MPALRAAMLYGVFGLIRFLAQAIVGFEMHILQTAVTGAPRPGDHRLRAAIYAAWLGGVPALAFGLFFTAPTVLAAGAWLLFAGVVLGAADGVMVVGDFSART